MAKKAAKRSVYPYLLEDRTGTIPSACPIVALADSFEAVRTVHKDLWPEVKVRDHVILREYIAPDRETAIKENAIYFVKPATDVELKRDIDHLRYMSLEYNATPEAIRLLGSLEPWTAKEEKIMAEKLKAKAKPVKASTEELKSAAKKTPVGGAKKKGNAEALAKARAARSTGPDTRKITALKKAKDITARPGSYRHTMLTDLLASKTVQDFRNKNSAYSAGDLRYAESAGYVKIPAKA